MKAKLMMGVKYGNQPKLQHMDFGGKPGATLPAKRITGPRVRQMKAIKGLGGKGK